MGDLEEDIIKAFVHLTRIGRSYQGHWQIVLHMILSIVLIAEKFIFLCFIGDSLFYLWANTAKSMETTNGSSVIPDKV